MERADVIILGGGLVGLTLALALDKHGLTSIVVDPADPATQIAPSYDGRATAVSSSSWRMLEAIGVGGAAARRHLPDPRDPGQRRAEARRHRCSIPRTTTIRSASCSRTGCSARRLRDCALAAERIDAPDALASPPTVVRDGDGVRVTLADGRTGRRAAA